MILINEPWYSNIGLDLVTKTIESGDWSNKSVITELEWAVAKASDTQFAVAIANATVGLELILESLHLYKGSEVITSPFTFSSTITSILKQGGIPVFADVLDDFTIDPESVKKLITSKTQAIIAIHMFGFPADVDFLKNIAQQHGLDFIEDASQSLGAKYKGRRIGSTGTASVFSFYSTKNIGCGEGGCIVTNDRVIYDRCLALREPGLLEIDRLSPPSSELLIGSNRRINGIAANLALDGVNNIKTVNPIRYNNAFVLQRYLGSHPHFTEDKISAWNTYPVISKDRDTLQKNLAFNNIETKVYYPELINYNEIYRKYYPTQETPNAKRLSDNILSLPVHHKLSEPLMQYIGEKVAEFERHATIQ